MWDDPELLAWLIGCAVVAVVLFGWDALDLLGDLLEALLDGKDGDE